MLLAQPLPANPVTRTITLDLVVLPASTRDPLSDVAFANRAYAAAHVQFLVKTVVFVPSDVAASWLDGAGCLDIGPCGGATEEELRMVVGATQAYTLTSEIRVFYLASTVAPRRASCCPAYCATGRAAPLINIAIVTNAASPRSLAHEIGHLLLDSDTHESDPTNLMHPTNTAVDERLTLEQCATIYAAAEAYDLR